MSSPTYPQESTQNQYTYPNLSDYVGYSHVSQLSPEQYRYIDPPPSHILREQHSPTADGYYQHFQVDSLTYNAATYHEENHRSSVFEATQGQLHMVAELQAGFDDNQGIPEFPLGADKEEDSNQSLPPVGSEENETVKQASVESLPKKVNPRRSKKRKQETPQDQDQAVQKPKQKRIRRAKKNLGAPEYIPVGTSGILCCLEVGGDHTLLGRLFHTSSSRSPPADPNQVQMRQHTEVLESCPRYPFFGPKGDQGNQSGRRPEHEPQYFR